MAKKISQWTPKGMNQDLSVSKFNPEFAFENMNLRLSTNEGNTLMSWVNERGPEELTIHLTKSWDNLPRPVIYGTIPGKPLGYAVISHTLVLFTKDESENDESENKDYIIVLKKVGDTTFEGKFLFEGNLDFDLTYPIETHVSFEEEDIQKVYWTDGKNQPRMINIKVDKKKINLWHDKAEKIGGTCTFFNFSPNVTKGDVSVEKMNSGGIFAPGVIQYAFTYINKHGQQSNIIEVSDLQYISDNTRGASPEESVNNSFEITVSTEEQLFDAIRLYSIQRTSINAAPIVKLLDDIPFNSVSKDTEKIYYNDIFLQTPTLPKDYNNGNRLIFGIKGSFSLSGNPYYAPDNIDSLSDPFIVQYERIQDHKLVYEDWITVQELLDLIHSDYNDCYLNADTYAGIFFGNGLLSKLKEKISIEKDIRLSEISEIGIKVAGSYVPLYNSTPPSLVYDFSKQVWRFFKGTPSVLGLSYTYIDNGTTGSSMDPTELLYIGGKEIKALTMTDKDGTLFLGNITQMNSNVAAIQQYVDDNREALTGGIAFNNDGEKSLNNNNATGSYYSNTLHLDKSDEEVTAFKGGETYRLGFQLQKKNGEWSEPIYLCDKENDKYPSSNSDSSQLHLPYAEGSLDISGIKKQISNFDNIYTRIRPVVVYPSVIDRTVLCQGVINPTVFNTEDRVTNSPYGQASWFFRPYSYKEEEKEPLVKMEGVGGFDWEYITGEDEHGNTRTDLGAERYCIVRIVFNDMDSWKKDSLFMEIVRRLPDPSISCAFKVQDGSYCFAVMTSKLEYFIPVLNGSTYGDKIDQIWAPCNASWGYTPRNSVAVMKEGEHNKFDSLAKIMNFKLNTFNSKVVITTYLHQDGKTSDGFVKFDFTFPANMITEGQGNAVGFAHYKSLITQEEAAGGIDNITLIYGDRPKQVEIQGSVKSYENYNSTGKRTDFNVNSNTQFFVDQSLLTLNSPDIEYDTEVQSYNMEGVKMRIIGAIPIQATASSHQIRISTPTLPTHYNEDGDHIYGQEDRQIDVRRAFDSTDADKRLVAEFNWNDAFAHKYGDEFRTLGLNNFLICPWNKVGSLNNDYRDLNQASSKLNTKKMSNLLYSYNTDYFSNHEDVLYIGASDNPLGTSDDFPNISAKIHLRENEELINYRLAAPTNNTLARNYYPNIYKTLYSSNGYKVLDKEMGTIVNNEPLVYNTIEMRYKSNSHVVISTGLSPWEQDGIKLPLFGSYTNEGHTSFIGDFRGDEFDTFWKEHLKFTHNHANMNKLFNGEKYGWLWVAELYKDVQNRFGGTSENALKTNKWNVAGETVDIPSGSNDVVLRWTKGDTYYQRYDCMKTYAYSPEDPNQMVEMLSFMCETHVNLDGIYDKDRGTIIAYNLNPNNFGHINPVYSQRDNFFTTLNRKINWDTKEKNIYPNILTYTKTKELGADVDNWTNITLASILDLDGDKGQITSLNRFNNELIAFQETGISQILYNESAQISTTAGVPIELGNSGKVQGKRYISDTIGCANKWSIAPTPSGLYFMDSYDRGIYRYSGKLENISAALGFNSWCKTNIHKTKRGWNPKDFDDFVAYYDKNNQDVQFINKDYSLAFSERFGVFTSFYDYGNTPYFCNFEDTGIWLKPDSNITGLYEHQKGLYCNFFGSNKPYWMTLVGNPEPVTDKIFTNLEFRANVSGEGTEIEGKYSPTLPFDSLEAWNEYQHGYLDLSLRNSSADRLHSSLQRKFRMWRCDIPRDNVPAQNDSVIFDKPYTADSKLGITRFNRHINDRMRNPWIYLKLTKNIGSSLPKAEIHDLMMTYYN